MGCYTISVFSHAHTSGKIIAAALFGVALLAFALLKSPFFGSSASSSGIEIGRGSSSLLDSEQYSADSDQDGVRDWEEVLLGLDPNDPDSNHNGINDGEELAAARKAYEKNAGSASANGTSTQTDLLAQEIFGAYIQSKQQGTYNSDSFDFMIAQATNAQFSNRFQPLYTLDDIATTQNTATQEVLRYEQKFQDAITPVTTISEYELTTYGRAIETRDEAEFEKLVSAANVYESIAHTLLSITVPEDAAQPHLDLINSFATFAEILTSMSSSPEDPVLTFVATRNFIEGEDAIKTAYSQIDIYFTLKEANL